MPTSFISYYSKLKSFRLIKFYYFYKEKIEYPYFLWKYRLIARVQKKTIVHFLHIGKTGGTALKNALKNKEKPLVNNKYIIISHPHFVGLNHVFKGEKIFFFVRNPVDRFVSGFYSRKRKGMPHIYNEWRKEEAIAFNTFDTPNELALGLTSSDKKIRRQAYEGIMSIGHLKTSYWDWFKHETLLEKKISDIIFVGSQKNLGSDFEKLREILEIPKSHQLPKNEVAKHKNPENYDRTLDDQSIKNLKWWYKKDYYFLQFLKEKLKENGGITIDYSSNYY